MIDSRALLSSSTCTSPLRRQHIPVGEGDRGARELKPDILFGFFDKDIYLCANPNIKTLGAHHSADPSYLARLRTLCKAADTMDDSCRCVRCFKAVSWTHPHCPHCGGRWERCYEQTYVAQQRRPRSNKNRQKSSQQNAWEWSWEEESTPTRPASLREVFPPNSKHLVVDVGKHGPRAEATRRRFRILLHQPCRPHGNQTRTSPRRQHKQPALQRMPGPVQNWLCVCERHIQTQSRCPRVHSRPWPRWTSDPRSRLSYGYICCRMSWTFLSLRPRWLRVSTIEFTTFLRASRNYRFKMIQRLCWRLFSRALPQPLKDDGALYVAHLYSGWSRAEDFHHWMSQLLDQEELTNIRILSLDTATHDCMNVHPMKLWNFLLDIARSGRLIALLLIGPPCDGAPRDSRLC